MEPAERLAYLFFDSTGTRACRSKGRDGWVKAGLTGNEPIRLSLFRDSFLWPVTETRRDIEQILADGDVEAFTGFEDGKDGVTLDPRIHWMQPLGAPPDGVRSWGLHPPPFHAVLLKTQKFELLFQVVQIQGQIPDLRV